MDTDTSVEAVRDLAVAATETREQSGVPYVLAPQGYEVKDLKHLLPNPPRKTGHATLTTLDSFIDYVKEHQTPASRIFATITDRSASFKAVLDYHEPGTGKANWGQHTAGLTCEATVEWTRWMGMNEKPFNQVQFAEFIEKNQLTIVTPPGAELLELVQTLEAKKNVRFDSVQRLSNGKTALKYEEDVTLTGSTGTNKGQIDFPTEMKLALAPFKGGSPFGIQTRVRHRIKEREMFFSYDIVDPHLVIETVCEEMIDRIKAATKLTLFHGNP